MKANKQKPRQFTQKWNQEHSKPTWVASAAAAPFMASEVEGEVAFFLSVLRVGEGL